MIIETTLSGLMATAVAIATVFLVAAFVLTTVRLILGPTLPDRVVALDLLTMLVVAFLALFTLATLLGLASLTLFFLHRGPPTRLQFALLTGAVAVIFYLTFQSNAR